MYNFGDTGQEGKEEGRGRGTGTFIERREGGGSLLHLNQVQNPKPHLPAVSPDYQNLMTSSLPHKGVAQ